MISDEMLRQGALEYEQALLDSLPEDLPRHTFSQGFEKKMSRICHKTKHPFAYRAFKRVACALIVVTLIGSMALMSSAQGHATVMGWINMVSDYFSLRDTAQTRVYSYDLSQIPEGYRLVEQSARKGGGFVLYANAAGQFLVFDYQYDPNGGVYYMKMENHIHLQETVNGQEMDIYISQDPAFRNAIVWSVSGEATFSLSAYLEKNDLMELTEKVIPKK